MGSMRVGRCLKSFLEVLRFVVTEYCAVRSHGDLIRVENYVFCLRGIWEALGELEAEEASDRHLEVRSHKLQPLSAKMQFSLKHNNFMVCF